MEPRTPLLGEAEQPGLGLDAQASQLRNQQTQPRRRRRPAHSCRECRRRKIKCDQKDPCAHCSRHRTPCTYQLFRDDSEPVPPRRRSKAPPRGSTASPTPSAQDPGNLPPYSHRVNHEYSQQQLTPAGTDTRSPRIVAVGQPVRDYSSASGLQVSTAHPETVIAAHRTPATPSVQDLLLRIRALEERAPSQPSERGVAQSLAFEPNEGASRRQDSGELENWQAVLLKPRDLGRGDWMLAMEFAGILACWSEIMGSPSKNTAFREPETEAIVKQAGDLMQKCKKTAKSIKLARPTRGLSPSSPEFLAPPPREMSDTLANLYFQFFESSHRILHVPTFWANYENYWDQLEPVTTGLRLTILLAIGIGSSLYDHGSPEATLQNAELVQRWIYAAETWLAGPLEKDRVDLTGLQVYCLTILARQIFSIGGDTVWMSIGSLIHRAIQIGLHRDPKNLLDQSISTLQAEVRRRLWATILEFAVQASLDSRMPPRISFDEFDTGLPSNIDDTGMDESTSNVQSRPKNEFTSTSIQLALLSSLPTRLRIVKLLNGIGVGATYDQVLTLSSELIQSLHANSKIMKEASESTPFHRNLLDYMVRRFLIPLHFSFSNQASQSPIYYHSLKVSVDAAAAIMSPEPDAVFSRLMVLGGGLFREGIRVAMMPPSLELLFHVQEQNLDGTLQRSTRYRESLKQLLRDMISLSAERIRMGETNVKSHMFQSMIIAQAESIESGSSVELEIVRSARDSLEYCYSIIKSRADKMSLASTPSAGLDTSQGADSFGFDLDWGSLFSDQAFFNTMDT